MTASSAPAPSSTRSGYRVCSVHHLDYLYSSQRASVSLFRNVASRCVHKGARTPPPVASADIPHL